MTVHGDEDAPSIQLRELEELIRLVARRGDITLAVGEPGGSWRIALESGRVTCDPVHLATRSADYCRGLALHEAAHACLTRYHEQLPPELLRAPGMMTLLNVVEDCRIETWLAARLPGCKPWIQSYNDDLFGNMRVANPRAPRSSQFLAGLLATWWYGHAPEGMNPDAAEALAAATPALLRAVRLHPPVSPMPGGLLREVYARHPLARAMLAPDSLRAPDDDEIAARLAQYAAWSVIYAEILPHYLPLVEKDAPDQRQKDAFLQMLRRLGVRHIRDPNSRMAGAEAPAGQAPAGASGDGAGTPGTGSGASAADLQRAVEQAFKVDPRDRYLQVWQRLHATIDRLADEVIEVFELRNRSRLTRGHPAGVRVTLRAAMQFEARPEAYDQLWERISRPDRVDPVMVLLVDRSQSMQGANIQRTFEGIVLLSEVAARAGIPLEVVTFNTEPRQELSWDEGLAEATRRRLGSLPERCDGGTDLATGLAHVHARLEGLPFRDPLVVVLSDGETADAAAAKTALRRLRATGARVVGLGIGEGVAAMHALFPGDPVGVSVDEVPSRFVAVLRAFVGL